MIAVCGKVVAILQERFKRIVGMPAAWLLSIQDLLPAITMLPA
jgi:hypothetical protein